MDAFRNYINGEFVESKSRKTFPNINPANFDEVVGTEQWLNAELPGERQRWKEFRLNFQGSACGQRNAWVVCRSVTLALPQAS